MGVYALVLCVPLLCAPVRAEDAAALTRQLDAVQNDILRTQQQLSQARGRSGQLERELRDVELALAQAHQDLARTQATLEKLGQNVQTLTQQQRQQTQALHTQRAQLAQQLERSYLLQREHRLKLLLQQQDPQRMARLLAYYDYFHQARMAQMARSQSLLRELEQTLTALEQTLSARQEQLQIETALHQRLSTQRTQRTQVLAELRQEIQHSGQQLRRLQDNERHLERLLRELEQVLADIPADVSVGTAFAKLKGRLPWPVAGPMRSAFGASRQEGITLSAQGVVLDVPTGTAVRAIHAGRVAFAQWMHGFGLLLILDHGEGYMSLYAHNHRLEHDTGAWVQAGEVITHSGDTGGLGSPGLYFEIRHQGRPVNPAQWCHSNPDSRR
ncbi:murein hydrolase activator EnvC family protein [Thiorhodospira sibirica]|uniref:murein hydrolase activator EnvC family protein n=1 Tax=Thiorhodospira sibirica TaxID=154347 RepID=UPI00022C1152|nr:peptidoglycan DD-metalloendopeptidase family protein [Thiorhodospira sibirica]